MQGEQGRERVVMVFLSMVDQAPLRGRLDQAQRRAGGVGAASVGAVAARAGLGGLAVLLAMILESRGGVSRALPTQPPLI